MEGYREHQAARNKSRRYESAWLAHILLMPHRRQDADPITPAQLLGLKEPRQRASKRHFARPVDAFDAWAKLAKQKGLIHEQ